MKKKFNKNALKVEDWSYILQPFLPNEVFRSMEQRKVRQVMVKDDFVVRFMGQTYYPDKHDLSGVMEHLASKLVKVYKLYGIVGSLAPICMWMPLYNKPDNTKRAMLISYPALPWRVYGASAIDGFCFNREGWLPPLYDSKEQWQDQFKEENWYGFEQERKKK